MERSCLLWLFQSVLLVGLNPSAVGADLADLEADIDDARNTLLRITMQVHTRQLIKALQEAFA